MPIPTASAVPRESTASTTPKRRPHSQDQPAGGEPAEEEPGRRPGDVRPLAQGDRVARERPSAKTTSTNGRARSPRAISLAPKHPQPAGALGEERLQRAPAVLAAESEHPEHEREHAAEERKPAIRLPTSSAAARRRAAAARAVQVRRVRHDVGEDEREERPRSRAGSRCWPACAAPGALHETLPVMLPRSVLGQLEEDLLERCPLRAKSRRRRSRPRPARG